MTFPPLPIDQALPRLRAQLGQHNAAVLVAPPGAGKTTRVPLVLAGEAWVQGKTILVLEPRRLAARAAAEHMARALGERVGDTVGLRMRFGSKVSPRTRIEIITEGIFARLIGEDPALERVAAVVFDEFHERSLDADLALALARDAQEGLREDLRLLVMSATIDGARVAKLLGDAAVIESAGRSYPVATRYLGRDMRPIEAQVADAIVRALRAEPGSVLAFLPGAGEIRRTLALLTGRLDAAIDVVPLYGALGGEQQAQAIAPARPGRRKVVLATAIAETSITIEGVRVVIDSGLSRVPRYEGDVGLTRLETVRVSRAAADQRQGRAGRTEPGLCYRLWDEPQTASLAPFARPEILSADLSAFALELAAWGASPQSLTWLDPPPRAAFAEAKSLLVALAAVDEEGRITEEGRLLRRLPLPPRLARMVVDATREQAASLACEIAAILTERGLGGEDVDLRERLAALARDRSPRAREARAMARRWVEIAAPGQQSETTEGTEQAAISVGALLALAYPDRIAKNRGAGTGAFVLANGRGARVDPASPLTRAPFLAVGELIGAAAAARILSAAPITLEEIEARFGAAIATRQETTFEPASASLRGRKARRLGALVLSEQPVPVEPSLENAHKLAAGIGRHCLDRLPFTDALRQWRDRVMFLRLHQGAPWPDLSDAALTAQAADWLAPALCAKTALADLSAQELTQALTALLPWPLRKRLDAEAPSHFEAPTGSRVPIDYAADGGPTIAIRIQELFGLDRHPTFGGAGVPLIITLLSPAHRPVQTTRDLPGFWRGSYASVRAEMRGRYPRHPWPDDPLAAAPTRRAKPRRA